MGGATILSGDYWYQGLIAEAILTLILTTGTEFLIFTNKNVVLVVLMSAVDTKDNVLAPLAIGLSVTLDIFGA